MVSKIDQYRSNAPQLVKIGQQLARSGKSAEALETILSLLGILGSAVEYITDNQKELYVAIMESRNQQSQQPPRPPFKVAR